MAGIRNIGILAHVDTGKTTLTEAMLYRAGAIRTLGQVDDGTTHTDTLAIERQRGITVKSAAAALTWQDTRIQLIDTPGHVDFTAEVERALWALDAVVLLVSAVEGVQAHTQLLFDAIRARKMPALLFLNKADRPTADVEAAAEGIRRELSPVAFLLPRDALEADGKAPVPPALYEALAEADDAVMERYLLDEPMDMAEALPRLREAVAAGTVYPILWGSALRGEGIEMLLTAMVRLLPPPSAPGQGLSGIVFGVEEDRQLGRAAHVRLFDGALAPRDTVDFRGAPAKVTVLRSLTEGKRQDLPALKAGEVGAVYGLPGCRVGDILGPASRLPLSMHPGDIATPLLLVQADPDVPENLPRLREALEELTAADPLLDVRWSSFTRTLQVQIMGAIQLEVLASLLQERYGLKASFGEPAVIYRETVAQEAFGFCAYTWPKPCWALLRFQLTPLPRGSGVRYECRVPPSHMLPRYQKQVEQTIPLALRQGRLGWPVTDLRVTLVDGQDHKFHTHPLDFVVATPWALHDGLTHAGSVLLEPMIEATVTLPMECGSRLMALCLASRGEAESPVTRGDVQTYRCRLPVATTLDLPIRLAALSGGRATLATRFAGYEACPLELGRTAPRRSVDPLDTSRYILAARSALDGGIFGEDW